MNPRKRKDATLAGAQANFTAKGDNANTSVTSAHTTTGGDKATKHVSVLGAATMTAEAGLGASTNS